MQLLIWLCVALSWMCQNSDSLRGYGKESKAICRACDWLVLVRNLFQVAPVRVQLAESQVERLLEITIHDVSVPIIHELFQRIMDLNSMKYTSKTTLLHF